MRDGIACSRENPEKLLGRFLNLSDGLENLKSRNNSLLPTTKQCIAHLKLLECFHRLREDISSRDRIFSIGTERTTVPADKTSQEQLRDKRWVVYVTRAVERYTRWWNSCVVSSYQRKFSSKLGGANVGNHDHEQIATKASKLNVTEFGGLPPLGASDYIC